MKKEQWRVVDHNKKIIHTYRKEVDALSKAREIAENNRPSRLLSSRDGKEREVDNYPRIPV